MDSDRPEILSCLTDLLEGVNEFITGPCEENQDELFSVKNIELLSLIIRRKVADINHDYYELLN